MDILFISHKENLVKKFVSLAKYILDEARFDFRYQ